MPNVADHIVINVSPMLDWVKGDFPFYLALVYYSPIDRWLAMCGMIEFRLLSTPVVNSLIVEAFQKKLLVYASRDGVLHPLDVTNF